MVRTYVRKTNRASYGPHILQEALDAIKEGKMSKKKASEYYGIPRPTLIKRLKNPNHSPHNLGRFKPVFDNAFESELVMHCVEMHGLRGKRNSYSCPTSMSFLPHYFILVCSTVLRSRRISI